MELNYGKLFCAEVADQSEFRVVVGDQRTTSSSPAEDGSDNEAVNTQYDDSECAETRLYVTVLPDAAISDRSSSVSSTGSNVEPPYYLDVLPDDVQPDA